MAKLTQIGGYFLATAAQAAVAFISVPLLIRALGVEQFGRWSLIEPMIVVLSQVALLGSDAGLLKQISHDKLPLRTSLAATLVSSHPVLIGVSLLPLIFVTWLDFLWVDALALGVVIYLEAVVLLFLAAFRAENSVLAFCATTIAKVSCFLVTLIAIVKFTPVATHVAEDVLLWRSLAVTIAAVLGFAIVGHATRERRSFDHKITRDKFELYWDAVCYGLPVLITSLLTLIIEFAGRYFLRAYTDYTALGKYVVYLKIAAALALVVNTPLGLWWPTERFRRFHDPDGGRSFFRVAAMSFLAVLLLAGGILWFVSGWVLSFVAPGVPFEPDVILVLILSVVATGMAAPLNLGLLMQGNTRWNIYGVLIAAIAHLLLCTLLIPPFGIKGAAWATALSYLTYTLLLNAFSQAKYFVPFAYVRMASLVILSIGVMICVQVSPLGNGPESIGTKILIYTVMLIVIYWLIGRRELTMLWKQALG